METKMGRDSCLLDVPEGCKLLDSTAYEGGFEQIAAVGEGGCAQISIDRWVFGRSSGPNEEHWLLFRMKNGEALPYRVKLEAEGTVDFERDIGSPTWWFDTKTGVLTLTPSEFQIPHGQWGQLLAMKYKWTPEEYHHNFAIHVAEVVAGKSLSGHFTVAEGQNAVLGANVAAMMEGLERAKRALELLPILEESFISIPTRLRIFIEEAGWMKRAATRVLHSILCLVQNETAMPVKALYGDPATKSLAMQIVDSLHAIARLFRRNGSPTLTCQMPDKMIAPSRDEDAKMLPSLLMKLIAEAEADSDPTT